MKRILSFFLSMVVIVTAVSFTTGSVAASDRIYAEDALESLQTQTGYIPGKTAAVVGNCYAFISSVCEKLYGVTYYYEQQVGNYQFKHETGNYYTVATKTLSYSSSDSVRRENAREIMEFLLSNATPGDVLQFGCADSLYSKRHTVMIQHVDGEKLVVYHSNYETNNISASACRVDTIYWDSFLQDPMQNEYKGSSLYSMNLLFGSNMKLTGGMGMTINRYTGYESKYILDIYQKTVPSITSCIRVNTTSVELCWENIKNASKYMVKYKLSGATEYTTYHSKIKTTSIVISGLKTGKTYTFYVKAYVKGKWQQASKKVSKQVLPPTPSSVKTSNQSQGVKISWTTKSDVSGYKIYRSTSKNGTYKLLKTINNPKTSYYIDTSVQCPKTYYYKVERFLVKNSKTWSSPKSGAVKQKYYVSKPKIKVETLSANSVRITWNSVSQATKYTLSYGKSGSKSITKVHKTKNYYVISGLKKNASYDITLKAKNDKGSSKEAKITMTM